METLVWKGKSLVWHSLNKYLHLIVVSQAAGPTEHAVRPFFKVYKKSSTGSSLMTLNIFFPHLIN